MSVKVIPETIVDNKRLGRHYEWDDASLDFLAPQAPAITDVSHELFGLPFNQGNIGDCTTNALCGSLNVSTEKLYTEKDAVNLYKLETQMEGDPYPPNDPGGTGLMVCKAAKQKGWITSYTHAVGLQAALQALVLRPVITGINWYTSFDEPASNGQVSIAKGATVRGGHEIVAFEIDTAKHLVWFWNSWGTDWALGGKFCMSWHTWYVLFQQQGDVTVPIL